jgi:hypothetical protein
MRFGTWNARSMYRADSLRTVAEEISKYKLDLVGVPEIRWDRGGTEPASEYTFFYGKGNENHELGTGFSVHKRIITLRGCSCDIIVLDVHAPTEDKSDDVKDRFYGELEQVFYKFPNCHMKVLLGDYNASH